MYICVCIVRKSFPGDLGIGKTASPYSNSKPSPLNISSPQNNLTADSGTALEREEILTAKGTIDKNHCGLSVPRDSISDVGSGH